LDGRPPAVFAELVKQGLVEFCETASAETSVILYFSTLLSATDEAL
jgi:hypothetical protein